MSWWNHVDVVTELSTSSFDDTTPTFTNISSYVRDASPKLGRNNQLERFGPGTNQVTLDNSGRVFDPSYSSGAFYPNLLPMNRLRQWVRNKTASLTETFTGSDGATPTGWTDSAVSGAGASVGINSNRLRFVTGTTAFGLGRIRYGTALTADIDLRCTVDIQALSEQYVNVYVRCGSSFVDNQLASGYAAVVDVAANILAIYEIDAAGATTQIASGAVTWTAAIWNVRVLACGKNLSAKAWTTTEPDAWTVTVEDTTFSGTSIGLRVTGGNNTTSDTIYIDNLTTYPAYPLAYGFVDGWPQDYHPSNNDATVQVPITDLTGYAANVELADAVTAICDNVGLRHRYLLNDPTEDIIDSVGARNGASSATGVTRNAAPLTIFHTGSLYFDGTGQAQIPEAFLAETSTYSVSYVFSTTDLDTDFHILFTANTGQGIGNGLYLNLDFGSDEPFRWTFGASFPIDDGFEPFPTGPADGATHHVLFIRTGDVIDIWLDGSHVVDSLATGQGTAVNTGVWKIVIGGSDGGSFYTGSVADYIIFDGALSDTQASDLATAYRTAFDGDDAATRTQRILDAIGYAGAVSLEAGEGRCGPSTLAGNAASLLQTIDATEQGRLFFDQSGTPTLHNRSHNITATRSTTTQCTFADDAAALADTGATDCPIYAGGLRFDFDKVQTINEVTVTSPALTSEVTVSDTATQATYGVQSRSISTVARSVRDAESVADFLITKYKTPQLRSDTWQVKLAAKTVCIPTLLGLKIGDRIVLERTPQGVGSQIVIPMYLERIEHRIPQNGDWVITFSGVPSKPESDVQYWELGTSELGTDTTLYV